MPQAHRVVGVERDAPAPEGDRLVSVAEGFRGLSRCRCTVTVGVCRCRTPGKVRWDITLERFHTRLPPSLRTWGVSPHTFSVDSLEHEERNGRPDTALFRCIWTDPGTRNNHPPVPATSSVNGQETYKAVSLKVEKEWAKSGYGE